MSQSNYENNSFPLSEGQVNLTGDAHSGCELWNVSTDEGTLSIVWREGVAPEDVTIPAGGAVSIPENAEATITAGVFHKA